MEVLLGVVLLFCCWNSLVFADSNSTTASCASHQFRCADGHCIPLTWWCDANPDCHDGSDEPQQCSRNRTCRPGQFQCLHTRKCLPHGFVCDGDSDCGVHQDLGPDTSDEAFCSPNVPACPHNQARCNQSQTCVPLAAFCDGSRDCPDGSDEMDFCKGAACEAVQCEFGCKSTWDGPKCFCPEGRRAEGGKCVDADECEIEDSCAQICKNLDGGFECECVSGYRKEGTDCVAVNVPETEPPSLLISTQSTIQRLHLDGTAFPGRSTLHLLNSNALDFSHRNRTLCYVHHNLTLARLLCSHIDDLSVRWPQPPPNLFPEVEMIQQIALDWVTNNWYYLDDTREMIFLCDAAQKLCRVLVDTDISKPRSIALDPVKGFMFFTKWGRSPPGLERARMDGAERKTLISHKIVYPYGVSVDYSTSRVYWVDTYLDYVEVVDYDGANRRTVMRGAPVQNLYGISFFERKIFVSSWHDDSVLRLDKRVGEVKSVVGNISRPFNLHVFHRQRQPEVAHSCKTNNGGCSHICVPNWNRDIATPKCLCSAGYKLLENGQCVVQTPPVFLLIAKSKPPMIKGLTLDGRDEAMLPVTRVGDPGALDVDVASRSIYFTDFQKKTIERALIEGGDRTVVLSDGLDKCGGIAYDFLAKNLYWTDEGFNTVNVLKLSNFTVRKTLIKDHALSPKTIIVDPINGLMYFADWSPIGPTTGRIERAWMDGTHRTTFIQSDVVWPSGLAIDHARKRFYWSDYAQAANRISSCDLSGADRRVVVDKGLDFPFGLASFNGSLFFVGYASGSVSVYDLVTKEVEVLERINTQGSHVKVFDAKSQTGENECKSNPCSHLCLTVPGGTACACPDGHALSAGHCRPQLNYTAPSRCPPAHFKCHTGLRCLPNTELCDGVPNCPDASDELNVDLGGPCQQKHCENKQFKCKDENLCVDVGWLCDGRKDCKDGSDELAENCPGNCDPDGFMCKSSRKCVPRPWVCDKTADCDDGSDEENCDYKTCDVTEFTCKNKRCISTDLYCNGIDDCKDASDETNCPHCDLATEFPCIPTNTCLPITLKCNKIKNCPDNSDERDCDAPRRQCEPHEFNCATLECIHKSFVCDGHLDCNDGSDEKDCDPKRLRNATAVKPISDVLTCDHPARLCDNNTRCVAAERLCDERADCADGSDEGFRCPERLCEHSLLCSHICNNAPEGLVCSCPGHLHLQADKVNCLESHPCESWGVCSQLCRPVAGRYKCSCFEGYSLQGDGFSCKSVDGSVPYVVFSNRHEIRGVDLQNFNVKSFISSLKNTIALDFFHTNDTNMIFWTDVIDDMIYRGTLVGNSLSNIEPVVQSGLATAEGLAVDWIGENLYWVESSLDQIEVARLNGSFRRTLVAGDMESPRAVALDPRDGWLFWTDWDNAAPRIERCSLAGTDRSIVVRVDLEIDGAWPNGLTLDYDSRRIYWIDARSDSIHSTKYDGKDYHEVMTNHDMLSHPFAITLFENYVYWTDWRTNSVVRANKWNGGDVFVIQKTLSQPFDIKILHPSRQPRGERNPCGEDNGGCSHLCLLHVNGGYKCDCPHVMKLNKDNKTCVVNERVLLIARSNEIRGVDLDQPYYHTIPTISLPQVVSPSQIEFLASNSTLFWTDSQADEVKRSGLTSGPTQTLIDTGIENPTGLAVDWLAKLLFIASPSGILVCNLNAELSAVLVKNVNVLSLAADPAKGRLFWVSLLGEYANLETCLMDGTDVVVLLTNLSVQTKSLSYDRATDRIYYVSGFRIYYYDFKRGFSTRLQVNRSGISAATVYGGLVYYADDDDQSVRCADKSDGSGDRFLRNSTGVLALRIYDPKEQAGWHSCGANKAGCQHLCLPTSATTHRCKCATGFYVDPRDSRGCLGIEEFIFYSINWEIRGLPLNGSNNTQVLGPISRVSMASTIDFLASDNLILWTDNDHGVITSINRDGTQRRSIIEPSEEIEAVAADWLSGLAVDWSAKNIYWSDPKHGVIEVSRLDGSARYVVLSVDVGKTKYLAVDPEVGILVWAGGNKLERSGLDGSNRQVLINSTTVKIGDVALDLDRKIIYFCDSLRDTIERMTYNGTEHQVLLNHSLDNPVALTLLDDRLYWVDTTHDRGSIKSANIHNLSDYTVLLRQAGDSLKDIQIFSKRRQQGKNACSRDNGGCEQLCLFNGTHPICACSYGALSSNGKTCEEHDSFVMFSKVISIDSIHMTDESVQNAPFASIKNASMIRNTIGLTFNYKRQLLFYSDIQKGSINTVHFNGTGHAVLVERQGSVEGVAYEQVGNALYWTCNNDPAISRVNLTEDGRNRSAVEIVVKLRPDDKPRGIAVDSCGERVYWTNWNSYEPSIERAFLTGFRREPIITTEIRMPNALTLDHKASKLYWSDARLDKIERCEYDGSGRVVLAKVTPQHPFALAVYGDLIFWTDWVMHAVLRADKLTGQNVVWLRRDVARPMGIVAVANDTNDCFANPCLRLNGGCEDICTLTASGLVQCSCRDDKSLSEDGKRCYAKLSACRSDSFRCSDGGCIPYILTCDGVPHCGDASDEEPGYCGHRNCPHMFQCLNKRCVGFESVCNEVDDCGDRSDEMNCTCNEETHFRCGSGACILKAYRCDMDPDCDDVSDEIGCAPTNCTKIPDTIGCPHTTACIRPEWFCDGENDCWDMSDEKNCSNKVCAVGEFQCGNGKCISAAKQCDGRNDCNDSLQGKLSSDEQNCKGRCRSDQFMCATTSMCIPIKFRCNGMPDCPDESDEHDCKQQCRSDQFKCANNDCIPISWQCDGAYDCSDKSDESEHCMHHECNPWEFRCNSTGRCIPVAWLCDGEKDCSDNADEHADQGCHSNKCKINQFQCADRACISKIFYCDGDYDCEDKSDEPENCLAECVGGEFKCAGNGKCVMEIYRCDGKDDCGDNSDEAGCGDDAEVRCVDVGQFQCLNGACVNETALCDGMDDCGDYSDEFKCHINECAAAVSPCAQRCVDKPVGYECACDEGFRVSRKDASLCEDVDECADRPCGQICRNTLGSFVCKCVENYLLAEDKVSCRADSDITPKLLLANKYYIRQLNLDGHSTLLQHNLTNGVAIDYDWQTKCIYWSDISVLSSSITKLCNSTKNPATTILHSATLKNPDGLAVDWVARNLYWCDKGLDTLEVSNLDGKYRKVILNEGLQDPRALAIDPIRRFLYWTDWGDNVHIGKAGMDGSNPRVIVNESLGWPNALTVAYETKEIFWADARKDYIAVADLDGGNVRIVASREKNPNLRLHHVFAITVWESYVYWTDWETKSIERCHKYHGNNCKTLLTTVQQPMDLRIVHPFKQPKIFDPCSTANCSALCLLSPQPPHYSCACPENYVLAANGYDCLSNCSRIHFECRSTFKCIPFWWKCDTQDDCGDGSDEPEDCRRFVCKPGQLQCGNERCVHPSVMCDGKDDCGDGSDERDCDGYSCLSNQFKCKGNSTIPPRCIPAAQRCDKTPNCPLAEDEADCPPPTCEPYQFLCDNGKCIPSVWVCDHDADCEDRSDEPLTCPNRTCPNDHFKCNSGRCIPLSWQCDGEADCSDKEDEPDTCFLSGFHTCEPTYFKCNNNRCIPGRWRCDYQKDCVDGSDEVDCKPRNCSESEFRCGDGKCIRGGQKCDGEFQCEDRSDEMDCKGKCGVQEFQCHSPQFCISLDWKCDGEPDCADASDEANCSDDCPDNGFKCDNGLCINEDWRCDGQLDCDDESDESLPMCSTLACPPGRMRCRNHRCVPMSAVCDNKDQCGDGSDEEPEMCKLYGVCPPGEYHCKNGKCIAKSLRCDGENDCGDNSDESDCVRSVCRFGSCSQECYERKHGNYTCKCATGFQISRDGGCLAQGRPANLVIAAETELRLISAYKPGLTNQFTQPQLSASARYKLNSFDILYQNERIFAFWTDYHGKMVQSVQLHVVERRTRDAEGKVVVKGLVEPRGLAVDWLSKRIYVTDARRILVATLDGEKFFTVVQGGMQQPRDIVVAPGNGVMFWADWGPVPRIETASMDGADRQILGLSNVLWPTGLAVDHPAERLYWADPKAYTIESARFDGSDRQIVKKMTHDERPYKLDVFEDFVYFSTHNSHNVMRMNKFGHGNASYLSQGLPRLADIVIVQEQKQRYGDDVCQDKCQTVELCLRNPSGATCVCPDGYVKDNNTCTAVSSTTSNCSLHCNSGTCKLSAAGPKCICPPQFSGAHCEHYRCSQFCRNKGMCYVDLITTKPADAQAPPLRCNCPPQWTGERCETPVNICEGRCFNGGSCYSPRPSTANCNCPPPFTGNRCQNCAHLNCTNGGVCDGTSCRCPVGYHGASCELSDCTDDFCVHGTCFITPKIGPRCRCFSGFVGSRCEQDSCFGHCRNGGVCRNGAKEPMCECSPLFGGRRCEIDLCASATPPPECCHCRNNGTCVDVGAEKVCDCKDGWGGETCEDYVGKDNNCTNRCKNGGVCQVGGYFLSPVCHCQEDWTGEICDEPIVCKYYCQNGGKCVVTDEVPHCTCPPAFEGVQCEVSNENFAKTVQETEPEDDTGSGAKLLVPALALCAVFLLVLGLGAAYFFFRQRRPFAHERLQENDFNNPMYQERDAEPFALDADKSNNFVNPVYETVYNGTSSAKEEKTGLLQVSEEIPPMTIQEQ